MKSVLILFFVCVAGVLECATYVDGFRSVYWIPSPSKFLTSSSSGTSIAIPAGEFILLALSSLSAPYYSASIDLDLPDSVYEVNTSTIIQLSQQSSFGLTLSLGGSSWKVPDSTLTQCAGGSCILNHTFPISSAYPTFKYRVRSDPIEDQWLAITDVQITGCSENKNLTWWQNLLIVAGSLGFLIIICVLIYHCIDLPWGSLYKRGHERLPH
jgi:hypothetical protein